MVPTRTGRAAARTTGGRWLLRAACASAGLSAALLGGCATGADPDAVPPGPLRIIVQTARADLAGPALADAAASASARPVQHLAQIGDGLHALWLVCGDAADCRASLDRLRAARTLFSGVWIDQRRRLVSPSG